MAYLSIAANQSRSAAERSAGEARAAARLAEDRLTAGLIAQGRRELNDNRGLAALAYFAEALRRGADTPGLRFMIALASRGWRDERLVLRELRATAIVALPDGFAIGGADGKIHLYDASARPVGEVQLAIEEIGLLRAHGDRLVAVGRRGVAVLERGHRTVLATIPIASPVASASLGPAADEVVVAAADALRVYGLDGALRRTLARDFSQSDTEPIWGAGHVFLAVGESVQAVDLRTMTAADDRGRRSSPGPSAARTARRSSTSTRTGSSTCSTATARGTRRSGRGSEPIEVLRVRHRRPARRDRRPRARRSTIAGRRRCARCRCRRRTRSCWSGSAATTCGPRRPTA